MCLGGPIGFPSLNALGAFWPGIQVSKDRSYVFSLFLLIISVIFCVTILNLQMVFGHFQRGIRTFGAYYNVWRQRGVLPEGTLISSSRLTISFFFLSQRLTVRVVRKTAIFYIRVPDHGLVNE